MRDAAESAAIRGTAVVSDRPDPGWYAVYVQDRTLAGVLKYTEDDSGVMSLLHTEIYPEWEGLGLAGILVGGALDDIRSRERTVDPVCTYVVGYMNKHPEYDDLVAHSARGESLPRKDPRP